MSTVETTRLNDTRQLLWVWIAFFVGVILLSVFYGPTASTYKYTYVEPANATGTLTSERWSYDFFFTGSMFFVVLAPITMAFMSDMSQKQGRRNFHVIVVSLLIVYFVAVSIVWSIDVSKANVATTQNARNPSNDPRWCCINFNLPSSGCPSGTTACPGVGQNDLAVNVVFLWKYIFVMVYIALLIVDLGITLLTFKPLVDDFLRQFQPSPLLQDYSEYDVPPSSTNTVVIVPQEPDLEAPSAPPNTAVDVKQRVQGQVQQRIQQQISTKRSHLNPPARWSRK